MPPPSRRHRPADPMLPPGSMVPERFVLHQALESWIYRQHVLTRAAVAKELSSLRAELIGLRKEIRAVARSQRLMRKRIKRTS